MKTKVDTAVLKQSLNQDSVVKKLKRCSSWPLLRQSSFAFSEAQSQTPSTGSTALQSLASGNSDAVNQLANDTEKMKIKDLVDRSSVSHRLTANQDPCPYRGLLNLGATCYLNATLQVLFMTQAFRERVLLLTPGDTSEKLESALKELFKELSNQVRGAQSISTEGIIKALGIQRIYEQQDAVEYFLDILEKVGPDLAEVFSGTMRNNRKCAENHESHDDSSFKSLQIALNSTDGPYRLEDGVQSYFASTILDGDDQMYCETCDEKSDTTWSCEIHEYPTILPLHLKRFVYDYWSCGFVKNDCPVDVPLHLSLGEQEYCLYAVINHRGSRYGGHYTADIRSFTENTWYSFDDSHVTEIDESKLERSREAYLLLYRKLDSPPVSQMRKETQNSHSTLTDPRTEALLQRSTAPSSSVARVEHEEEPKTKTTEPVETGRAEQCGGAHNKPQLEVSAVTGRLRILVLSRPETYKKTLAEMIVSDARFSGESQLQHAETIRDSLEMCSPGPHVVLWVARLGNNEEDFEAFEEIYRHLKEIYRPFAASEYIMIVFTSKGHPTESSKENAMQCYAGINNNHVLDINADLHVQVKELVTKLLKIVDQNENQRPHYDDAKKPQKRKHEKTKSMHKKEKASKRNL
ncbi:ubiquitin carboxyl-terminal hydrolase 8-like [Sinocyclocheilus anshuiensis]|uniref:ubiquitin carboxyl-terminal hydrolase 8-like n=1 Tax=Sinocyclocheilus anshuiensis TaxID=1608454 RepID=UPI0007B89366|nr:PREDICTED: ubiquitin carboxyl-terminal hydrolase 8-like [Sinocyclocheilus anshuiensis]